MNLQNKKGGRVMYFIRDIDGNDYNSNIIAKIKPNFSNDRIISFNIIFINGMEAEFSNEEVDKFFDYLNAQENCVSSINKLTSIYSLLCELKHVYKQKGGYIYPPFFIL